MLWLFFYFVLFFLKSIGAIDLWFMIVVSSCYSQQSKVKQAVGMLKPQLTHESPVTAIAAVQELEELAAMDLSAPLREEVQHPTEQN